MLENNPLIERVLNEIKDLPEEQLLNLLKIIQLFKKSLHDQWKEDFELQKELESWEVLSDEALLNFENSLD